MRAHTHIHTVCCKEIDFKEHVSPEFLAVCVCVCVCVCVHVSPEFLAEHAKQSVSENICTAQGIRAPRHREYVHKDTGK